MTYSFSGITLFADCDISEKAAKLFAEELEMRTGASPSFTERETADFIFVADGSDDRDCYSITASEKAITFTASGIRGLIFAFGKFLRKSTFENGIITVTEDISGEYKPDKRIRGHQLGYRTTPNTYDAWSYEDYRRYYLDIMYMGCNTVEHIPYENGVSNRNRLMKYDEEEFLAEACSMAEEYDLDVSLWIPNANSETDENSAERRKNLAERLCRVNAIFPPGGDPGDLPADEFINRCRLIKQATKDVSPETEMWPSAQAPHSIPNWGDDFVAALNRLPDEIDGIITGPNHAFDIDTLRRKVPAKYPIRFYPDITHNVRCEYPVHFDRDDWHFALATGLSRECTNPRPREYRLLHRLTRQYVIGSVSYSEGITDDVNKFVWSDMDFDGDVELRDSLLDYSRLFFPGVPADTVADGILRLELNWQCAPDENPTIDSTYEIFTQLSKTYSSLNTNWRFNQLLFRAECDKLLRDRRIFELSLVKKANRLILDGKTDEAKAVLQSDFSDGYKAIRRDIDRLAQVLFDEIGYQSDVEHYCANSWERGAVLETIDLPVTDRAWLLNRFDYSEKLPEGKRLSFMKDVVNRNKVETDEYYFSVALNGLEENGVSVQDGEIYMNFLGDRPHINTGSIPTCMFKIYDNFSYKCRVAGLTGSCDYKLIVSFKNDPDDAITNHRITVNGTDIYNGPRFGKTNPEYDRKFLAEQFISAEYTIPHALIENGCIYLEMSEPLEGVMFSEFRIVKA